MLILSFAAALSGCSPADPQKPKLGKVTGRVTFQGKPVTSGSVMFTPSANEGGTTGQLASGRIESDGTFTLTTFDTGDGAILGEHIVTVESRDIRGVQRPKMSARIKYELPKSTIPDKYSNVHTSPYRFRVKEGVNHANIDLEG